MNVPRIDRILLLLRYRPPFFILYKHIKTLYHGRPLCICFIAPHMHANDCELPNERFQHFTFTPIHQIENHKKQTEQK